MVTSSLAAATVVRHAVATADRTEASVARSARIARKTWQRRIQGNSPFTVAELSRIASVLGTRINDLVDAIASETAGTSGDDLRLYTLAEVAERLHVTEDWLLKRVRSRAVPARRSARKWTFAADDIRAAIDYMAAHSDDAEASEVSQGGA